MQTLFLFVAVPTAELVKRVKELYHKRVSDVRFLIPVLTGLKKQEIIAVLPKLIKQSPSVVKEVFNRLLGCFHSKCIACRKSLSFHHPLHNITCKEISLGQLNVLSDARRLIFLFFLPQVTPRYQPPVPSVRLNS